MQKLCTVCSSAYEAQRPQAKYCGDTCRKRASRAGLSKAKPAASAAAKSVAASRGSGLVAAVRAALESADRVNTIAGQHALELAGRIVNAPGMNTGVAALSKQLQAVVAEALANAREAGDAVDELEARRDDRRERAAGKARVR